MEFCPKKAKEKGVNSLDQADEGTPQEEAPAVTGGLAWAMGCYAVDEADGMPPLVDSSSEGEPYQAQDYEDSSQDGSEGEVDTWWGPMRDRVAPGVWEVHRGGMPRQSAILREKGK